MENALLVGLSRQMALSHELDVIANNIANIDTTGYKADNAAFSEFLMPRAARSPVHRQRPARQLRAGPRHLDRFQPRRDPAHRQSAQRRHRRQAAISWCRRRAASAIPATARSRSTPPASSSPAKAIRCSATAARSRFSPPTTTSSSARTASSPCARARAPPDSQRGKLQIVGFDQPQQLQKDGGSTFMAPDGVNAGPAPPGTRVMQGAIEKSNVNAVVEMARMIQITRSYTDIASHPAAAGRPAPQCAAATLASRRVRRADFEEASI